MKTLPALLIVLAILFTASCSVNEQLGLAYIRTVDTVGEDWHVYSEEDKNIDEDERERRGRKYESMKILRDDLAEELKYEKE